MNRIVNFYFWLLLSLVPMCVIKNVFVKKAFANLNYRGKYSADIKNFEIVFPQRVNEDGSFISHLVSHHHSKRSTKELDFIFYKIPIGGKDYLIELTPNRKLISPGAVVEIHSEDVRQSRKRKDSNESENLEKMFDSVNIKKLKNTECHFYGRVKGENISKAALSTCYGLAGFIKINKGFYTIEPVAEHNPLIEDAYPHILYEADGLENSSVCQTMGKLSASIAEQIIRKRRDSNFAISVPMYIETLIVMDKTMVSHHKDSDCENYVLTVFNMAFNLFHDASLGLMMTLTIVRIIRLEIEDDEMNLNVNADAEKTLRYFQKWQNQINPGDDSHPNHHDIAVLITRVNVCYSPSSCGLLGLSTIGKACDPKFSAALCEDNGLRLGFVIAHEIGHLLGADHDSVNSTCNGTNPEGKQTVMNPQVSTTAQAWSTCSSGFFTAFFENGLGTCLLDEPEDHHFNVQDLLPGVMYNADYQCRHLIALNTQECEIGSTCESLNCHVPGYACVLTNKPPVDGTGCGENMWCHNSKCIVVGERPGAIDGNWGEWSPWSECSRTCGSGVASSMRSCDRPVPANGGKSCVGERKRYKICAATRRNLRYTSKSLLQNGKCFIKAFVEDYNSPPKYFRFDISEEVNVSFVGKPCETGRPSFRDIQCGEFNDWVYPEDRTTHKWKAYYFHNDNPCALYCISENKQIAALKPRVVDGTMCYRGIRDICVGGTCKSLPCDLHFDSNAVEDACGVCHGDGTGCEFSEGVETLSKLSKGLTKLINIPSGTRNIKVEETLPTLSRIVVRDRDTKDIYIKGKALGLFSVPGSQAWLGMIRKNQEALNIPGPVSKPLTVWIQRLENVTVKWSMALPAEQQRKPEFAWDFLKWGPCSAKCGPGTQKSDPSCMEEKAGLVEDSFCADLEMPPAKVRPCQVTDCEPRWMIGDWKGCDSSTVIKQRKRVVFCVKPIGEGEGESQIVEDSFCTEPKPHAVESCENRQKREDSDFNKGSEHNFWELNSLKSEAADFGFHKKYDDYLTHFAALSVPQRKSETIPLHLVYSPHFKHYFRVLEEPYSQVDLPFVKSENSNFGNYTVDPLVQSKVSPDFYKSTFSGEQVDVSHFQPKEESLLEDGVNLLTLEENKRKKKALDQKPDFIEENFKKKKTRQLLNYPNYKTIVRNSNFNKQQPEIPKHKKRFISKVRRQRIKDCKRQRFFNPKNDVTYPSKHKINFPSLKKNRISRSKLRLHSDRRKSFNYTSPNLMNVIENLSENDSTMKNKYLRLLNKGRNPVNGGERRKLREFKIDFDTSNKVHKMTQFLKPFHHLTIPPEDNKRKLQKEALQKCETSELRRPMHFRDFDGSGIRKFNFKSERIEFNSDLKEESKINSKSQKLTSHENGFVSNPFDPLHVGKLGKKSGLKVKNVGYENMFFDKPIKKFHSKKLNGKYTSFFCPKRELKHIHDTNFVAKDFYSTSKRKRSSRKWRKPTKVNKELTNVNSGIERKNYLNNLFRDIHPKMKQEILSRNVRPLINMGRIVIDKDPTNNQQLDILFQDYDGEEGSPIYTQLPRPPMNKKKLTLRGQAVFDFYKKLEPQSNGEALHRSTNVMDEKNFKAENGPSREGKGDDKDMTTAAYDFFVGFEPRNDRENFYRSTNTLDEKNPKTDQGSTKEGQKKEGDTTTVETKTGTNKSETTTAATVTTTASSAGTTTTHGGNTVAHNNKTTIAGSTESRPSTPTSTGTTSVTKAKSESATTQISTSTKNPDEKKDDICEDTPDDTNCPDKDVEEIEKGADSGKKCDARYKKRKKDRKKKSKKKPKSEEDDDNSPDEDKDEDKKKIF